MPGENLWWWFCIFTSAQGVHFPPPIPGTERSAWGRWPEGRAHFWYCGTPDGRPPCGEIMIITVAAFSSLTRILGECSTIHSSFAIFFQFFYFKVEVSLCTLILLIWQEQSTMAQWAETTEAKCSLTSWMWASFQIGSHTMPGQR